MKMMRNIIILILALFLWKQGFSQEKVELLKYPEFIDITLKNGLRILLAEHHEQPAVFYRMLVKVGVRDESAGKEGLVWITASLLDQGTISRTGEEIAQTIDGIGGYLSASATVEYTTIRCAVLSEDIDTGLDLFSSIILEPTFPKKDFKRLKKQAIGEIKQSYTNPSFLARKHALHVLFGAKTRLGREKTEKNIKKITVEDVRNLYQNNFFPNNSILLVIGDFSKEVMLKKLEERFGTWESKDLKKREVISPSPLNEIRFRFVNKPDLSQGTIILLQQGIESHNPDNPAYQIMNYILGGGSFSSRLMTIVRSEEGKTYDIDSWGEYHPDFGTFWISTYTRNEEIIDTYKTILSEFEKFIEKGITEEELKKAKSFYLGNLPLRLESPDSIAMKILDGLYNNYTIEELRKEAVLLYDVTIQDVNRVAKKYLNSKTFVLIIVGSKKEIREYLGQIGKYKEVNYREPLVK